MGEDADPHDVSGKPKPTRLVRFQAVGKDGNDERWVRLRAIPKGEGEVQVRPVAVKLKHGKYAFHASLNLTEERATEIRMWIASLRADYHEPFSKVVEAILNADIGFPDKVFALFMYGHIAGMEDAVDQMEDLLVHLGRLELPFAPVDPDTGSHPDHSHWMGEHHRGRFRAEGGGAPPTLRLSPRIIQD